MVLEGLAVGEADRAVKSAAAGKFVYAQPLRGGDHAAGQAAAQHDVFEVVEFLVVAFAADVAVVLLVHAVKADKLEVVAVKAAGETVAQVFGDAAAQMAALAFEAFVVGMGRVRQFGAGVGGGGVGHQCSCLVCALEADTLNRPSEKQKECLLV